MQLEKPNGYNEPDVPKWLGEGAVRVCAGSFKLSVVGQLQRLVPCVCICGRSLFLSFFLSIIVYDSGRSSFI